VRKLIAGKQTPTMCRSPVTFRSCFGRTLYLLKQPLPEAFDLFDLLFIGSMREEMGFSLEAFEYGRGSSPQTGRLIQIRPKMHSTAKKR
jgi:hypothetical protein